ncbi:MAG: hypothetical protein JNM93_13350 [Bacteriovoracaceae bacterium]|nr:hypothetical protein [Bacteriovoracaceae bacterium]
MKLVSMMLIGSALMFSSCGMLCKKSCSKDACCKSSECKDGKCKKDAKKVEEKKKS